MTTTAGRAEEVASRSGAASSPVHDRPRRAGDAPRHVAPRPDLIIMTVVGFFPPAAFLWTSFTGYRPTNPDKFQGFVGISNYTDALGDPLFCTRSRSPCCLRRCPSRSRLSGGAPRRALQPALPGFAMMRTIFIVPMLITPIAVRHHLAGVMMMPDLGVLNFCSA